MRVPRRLIGFIAVFQSVLFLSHFFLYETWTFSSTGTDSHGALWIKLALGFLSVSFIAASLLTFLFSAAVFSWIIFGVARLAGLAVNFHRIAESLFSLAVVVGVYGVFNASWTRITRTTVQL